MIRTLEVRVIKDNIDNQLRVSREIFKQIDNLADVAHKRQNENGELVDDLKGVMQSLLNAGHDLSENASVTGKKVLDLLNTYNA